MIEAHGTPNVCDVLHKESVANLYHAGPDPGCSLVAGFTGQASAGLKQLGTVIVHCPRMMQLTPGNSGIWKILLGCARGCTEHRGTLCGCTAQLLCLHCLSHLWCSCLASQMAALYHGAHLRVSKSPACDEHSELPHVHCACRMRGTCLQEDAWGFVS